MFDKVSPRIASLTVSKLETNHEPYEFTLSEKYRKIAESELNEVDGVREQSLQLMREWIAKNTKIKTCRTDSTFLLGYLRARKFSVPSACARLEAHLCTKQANPQWFHNLTIKDRGVRGVLESGWAIVLPEHDDFGRQVVIINTGRQDPKRFTTTDYYRAIQLVLRLLEDDERNQIAGYVLFYDHVGLTLEKILMFGVGDLRRFSQATLKSMPVRLKMSHNYRMPTLAQFFFEICLHLFPARMRNRFVVTPTLADADGIRLDMMPKEYGGKVPQQEMIDAFIKFAEDRVDQCLLDEEMKIDTGSVDKQRCKLKTVDSITGSFKKLEVD